MAILSPAFKANFPTSDENTANRVKAFDNKASVLLYSGNNILDLFKNQALIPGGEKANEYKDYSDGLALKTTVMFQGLTTSDTFGLCLDDNAGFATCWSGTVPSVGAYTFRSYKLSTALSGSTNLPSQTPITYPEPNGVYGFNGNWSATYNTSAGLLVEAHRFLPSDGNASATDVRFRASTCKLWIWQSFASSSPTHTANTMQSAEVILKGEATVLGSSFAILGALTATSLLSF